MAKADEIFKQNAKEILEHGTDTRGQKVRPHWEDGTPAYTKKVFGVTNRYDLREEFPLLTLRKTGFKSCVNEILWIYQKCSNNIKDLKPHIWDEWADESGRYLSSISTRRYESDPEGYLRFKAHPI